MSREATPRAIVISVSTCGELAQDFSRFLFKNGFYFLGFPLPPRHATDVRGVNSKSRGHTNIQSSKNRCQICGL